MPKRRYIPETKASRAKRPRMYLETKTPFPPMPPLEPMARPRAARANLRTAGYLGVELKFVDTTVNATALGQTWAGAEVDPAANCLFAPTMGTGESNREGRKAIMKKVQINGYVYRAQASDQADVRQSSIVKIALVLDQQTNATQLSAEDVYVDADNVECQFRELEYAQRFRVLWSTQLTLGDTVAATDGANTCSITGSLKPFSVYKTINIPVSFVANGGNVADIMDNSLHVIAVTSAPATTDYIVYQSRVRFVG